MSDPWLAKLRKKKVSLKDLASGNGDHKPSLAGLSKAAAKPSLKGLVSADPVVIERPYQEPKPRTKEDFRVGGILFSGATIMGEITAGYRDNVRRPYGSVDVTNGDLTYTLHNRHGSWMHDMWDSSMMAEPARVAYWLGIDMSQSMMASYLTKRFEAELKVQGVPTVYQQRAKLEAEATAARKRTKNPPIKATPTKITLKGILAK